MLSISPLGCFSVSLDNIAKDKSISHRCAMFSLLCDKPSIIKNYLLAQDTLHTLEIAKSLGLKVEHIDNNTMRFIPPSNIKEPDCVLDCGNAGTAMRLYAGLLAGIKGFFVLSGDKYLSARPMQRIIKPLTNIGARIYAREGGFAPMGIVGGKLEGFSFKSNIASAQVKSAMILAALNASSPSDYVECELSRDHTERMLIGMGAELKISDDNNLRFINILPLKKPLKPLNIEIPSDPSSAFFFAVAATISPNSEVILKNVLLNKTRLEGFRVLEQMGATIKYDIKSTKYEEIGDIYVANKELKGVVVDKHISWLIDELPAIGIAMAFANGESEVRNANELRVKESDRISALLENLSALGIEYQEREDGYKIIGKGLKEATKNNNKSVRLKSFGDHRIAMSCAIAGVVRRVEIDDEECINVSFPNFKSLLALIAQIN